MKRKALLAGAAAIALGVALTLIRGYPEPKHDTGVFLSVAARMLEGDHLYRDVVDNKDPLFFYSYAGALALGGWRGPFALDVLWLSLSAFGSGLFLRAIGAPPPAVVAGAIAYPLALTMPWYVTGNSMLAALSLVPIAAWLWVQGSFAWAGTVLAAIVLFKVNMALVAVSPIAALMLTRRPPKREVVNAVLGFAAVVGAAAAVMAVRGEVRPYLAVLADNVAFQTPDSKYVASRQAYRGISSWSGSPSPTRRS